jgi:hypothetical protein
LGSTYRTFLMFRHYVDPNGHFYLTPICCYGSQKRQIVRRRHER